VTRACSEGPWTPIHCGTQSNPLRTRDLERRSSAPEPSQVPHSGVKAGGSQG
jgi:hypothetical protein